MFVGTRKGGEGAAPLKKRDNRHAWRSPSSGGWSLSSAAQIKHQRKQVTTASEVADEECAGSGRSEALSVDEKLTAVAKEVEEDITVDLNARNIGKPKSRALTS